MRKQGKQSSSCLSNEEWSAMKARWNQRCAYCGVLVTKRMQAEHCEPLSRGGEDVPENIVPSCPPCNQSKRNLFLAEWVFQQHGLLVQSGKHGPMKVAQDGRKPNTTDHLRGRVSWVPAPVVGSKESKRELQRQRRIALVQFREALS